MRSTHPIHSICAYGKKARYLTQDIATTSFGEKSSFAKLIKMNAINIALGTGFIGGATFLHYTEEHLKVPYREFLSLGVEVYDSDERKVDDEFYYFARKVTELHPGLYENNWETPLKDFMTAGLFHFDKIGNANVMWTKMEDSTEFLIKKVNINPYYCAKVVSHE